jgi:hypothetical protein
MNNISFPSLIAQFFYCLSRHCGFNSTFLKDAKKESVHWKKETPLEALVEYPPGKFFAQKLQRAEGSALS